MKNTRQYRNVCENCQSKSIEQVKAALNIEPVNFVASLDNNKMTRFTAREGEKKKQHKSFIKTKLSR